MTKLQYNIHLLLCSSKHFLYIKLIIISTIYFLFFIGKINYCMSNGEDIFITAEKNDSNDSLLRNSSNSDDFLGADEALEMAHRNAGINYMLTYDQSISAGFIQSAEQQLAEIPAEEKLNKAVQLLEEKSREYYELNQRYYETQLEDVYPEPKQNAQNAEMKALEKQTNLLTLAQNAFDEAEGALPKMFYDAISDYAGDLEKASAQYAEQVKNNGQLETHCDKLTRENLYLKDQIQDTEVLQEEIANLKMRAYNIEEQFNKASNDYEKEITELKNKKSYYKNKLKELNPDEILSVESDDI